jgi:hypothetical protein
MAINGMQFFHTWICLCLPEVLSCDYKVVACLLLIVERCILFLFLILFSASFMYAISC